MQPSLSSVSTDVWEKALAVNLACTIWSQCLTLSVWEYLWRLSW